MLCNPAHISYCASNQAHWMRSFDRLTCIQPFLAKVPKNSSWDIASTLPALIPKSPKNQTPINIHVHHEPIRVAYNTVVDLVPQILPPANPLCPSPDIVLHIGLAAGRNYFTIEQGSHSHGYGKIPDVDGQRFEDSAAEEHFPSSKYPHKLKTVCMYSRSELGKHICQRH